MGCRKQLRCARPGMGWRAGKRTTPALLCAAAAVCAQPALAGTFTNTQTGALANPGQTCAAAFTRTINVTETTPITDMDLALLIRHPDRSDTAAAIRHPNGTQVLLYFGGANTVANLNVVFDDEAGTLINTGSHTTADGPNAPPFENRVRPSNALSAFDGLNPQGNWLFLACDNTADGNAGTFERVELRFQDATSADLSLDLASNGAVQVNQNAVLDISVDNAGPAGATGVSVDLALGSGLTYQSVSGATRNAQGRFVLDPIANGGTASFQVTVAVSNVGPYDATAQVWTSDQQDQDSTPANNAFGEDDQDGLTLSPGTTAPNSPPALQCALGAPVNVLDWGPPGTTNGWTSGDVNNSYTVNGVPVEVTFTGNTNRFIARNLGGTPTTTPVSNDQFTGGGLFDDGVIMNVDFQAYSEFVTITFDYGDTALGAGGIQIPITDVDLGSWTDRIVATGRLGSTTVAPVYTTGNSNTVVGGGLTGTGGSANGQALGNSWITFPGSVDQVSITYSNVAASTGDPASQVISIENLSYCDPEDPELSGEKILDSSGLILPGETIIYRLTASSAPGANVGADGITVSDTLPDNLRFVSAQAIGLGTAGTFDPPLPAANTDCSGGACFINFINGSLEREQSGEVVIEAVVK